MQEHPEGIMTDAICCWSIDTEGAAQWARGYCAGRGINNPLSLEVVDLPDPKTIDDGMTMLTMIIGMYGGQEVSRRAYKPDARKTDD